MSLSSTSSAYAVDALLVRDVDGQYRPARAEEVLSQARRVLVAPELRAVGLDEDEQATRVGQLVGAFCRLGRLDLKGRQHWGYRSIRTPNHTPSRSGSQEIGRNRLRQGVSLTRCRV